jgi:hypothetical protein
MTISNNFSTSSGLQYRLNGGPWRQVDSPFPDVLGDWRSLSVPMLLSDLNQGENTIQFGSSSTNTSVPNLNLLNIDVTVNVSASESSAGSTPAAPPD